MKPSNKKKQDLSKKFSPPFIFFSILVVGVVGLYMLAKSPNNTTSSSAGTVNSGQNVTIVDGKQVVEIRAKGGYTPSVSTAKAGVPTVLKVATNGTFDCSSSIRIPSLNISKTLPASGVTEIALGNLEPGTLQGTCGMGMYHFQVNVQS